MRPELRVKAIGVGLYVKAVLALYLKLVECALLEARYEELPDARGPTRTHRVNSSVPTVKVTDYAYALCVGGPDGEIYALNTVDVAGVRSKLIVFAVVRAFSYEVEVEVG